MTTIPYCWKCGAKLADDARFCQVCGTPVGLPPAGPTRTPPSRQPAMKAKFPLAAIILIAILIFAVITALVVLLPFQPVEFNQQNEAVAANVNSVRLIVDAEIADVNVILKDLPGNQRVAVNISATGWRSIFGSDEPLALHFDESTNNSILLYYVEVSKAGGWQAFNALDVACDIYLDPSIPLSITITTSAGTITMNPKMDVTIQDMRLQASAGNVEVSVNHGVVIEGNLFLEATAGNVQLDWNEPEITENVSINLRTSAGSANVNVNQTRQLAGNVTLFAEATAGSVNFTIDLQNDVGARISATTTLGGIDIEQQGFSGNEAPLQSDNYPAGSNFDVTLKATTGGVNISANYNLGGTRS